MTDIVEPICANSLSTLLRRLLLCAAFAVASPLPLYAGSSTQSCLQSNGSEQGDFEQCVTQVREVCQAKKDDQFDLDAEATCYRNETDRLLVAWTSLQTKADQGADTRLSVLLRATKKRDLLLMQAECDYREETSVLAPTEAPARRLLRAFCEFRHLSKSYWNALKVKS